MALISAGDPAFRDEAIARRRFEQNRWSEGRVCPHCRKVDRSTALNSRTYQCNVPSCRKQFTVTTGTPFYRSHIPLNVWAHVAFLFSQQQSITPAALQKATGLPYKTAWSVHARLQGEELKGWLTRLVDSNISNTEGEVIASSRLGNRRLSGPTSQLPTHEAAAVPVTFDTLQTALRDIGRSPLKMFSLQPGAFDDHLKRVEQAIQYIKTKYMEPERKIEYLAVVRILRLWAKTELRYYDSQVQSDADNIRERLRADSRSTKALWLGASIQPIEKISVRRQLASKKRKPIGYAQELAKELSASNDEARIVLESMEVSGESSFFHAITGYILLMERAKLWLLATEDQGNDGRRAWTAFEKAVSDAIAAAAKLEKRPELGSYAALIGAEIRETWARGLIDRGAFDEVPSILREARKICPSQESVPLARFHIDLTDLQCQLKSGSADPSLLQRCLYDYPWRDQRDKAFSIVRPYLSERTAKEYKDFWQETGSHPNSLFQQD